MQELDREDYDDLEAYKIIVNMYDAQKIELVNLEKKLKDSQSKLKKTEETIKILNETNDNNSRIFSPMKNDEQGNSELKKLEDRKRDVEKHIDFIRERILKTRELVAQYSFVMNILRKKNNESENQTKLSDDFLKEVIDKIGFCKEIVPLDPMRVKEELDSLYYLFTQLK